MKIIRSNGEKFRSSTEIDETKQMFLAQWTNGNLEIYMKNVKRRVKEMFNVTLNFSTKEEFFDELVKNNLLQIIEK